VNTGTDYITIDAAGSLAGLLRERVKRSPAAVAYRDCDAERNIWIDRTWSDVANEAARWQAAFRHEGLKAGDRVGIILRNGSDWAIFDQAALGLGLVVVPLYVEDRAENSAYCLNDSGAKLLLLEGDDHWQRLAPMIAQMPNVARFVSLRQITGNPHPNLVYAQSWLPRKASEFVADPVALNALATIVYTSGTTGRPKGVMLSHGNILSNAWSALQTFAVYPSDRFLSFLPLSHMLERMSGYYLPIMAGATVAFARSVPLLAEDLISQQPTILVSVPRIYERVYARINEQLAAGSPIKRRMFNLATTVGWSRFEYQQGRESWKPSMLLWPILEKLVAGKIMARLGGRLRTAVAGGAALAPDISKVFIGLGLPILQGYGLTETSPLLTVNRADANQPASVGQAAPGTELKVGDNDVLLARGPQVMLGYWNNPAATAEVLSADGWINTGDQARIDASGHVYITGRIKDIIVLSNGEKVSPVDIELAIIADPLFEQVIVLGENKPYLSVFAMLNHEQWEKLAAQANLRSDKPNVEAVEKMLLERISARLSGFPGYAQVRRLVATVTPWTVENGFLTPTLKVKRGKVLEHFAGEVAALYEKK
jgi:long-chain acyl-CoA synthetase